MLVGFLCQRVVHEVEEQEEQEGRAGLNDGLSASKRETEQLRVELAEVRVLIISGEVRRGESLKKFIIVDGGI